MLYAAKHLAADFLTAIVFVAAYASTENLPLAVGATMATAVAQVGLALQRKQTLDPMIWLSLFLALAFGAAALISQDPRFVMAKPSLIHGAIAVAMLRRGWMWRYMDEGARAVVPEAAVVTAGYGWAAYMFALAAANLAVALTASFSTWAWFVSVGLLTAKAVGFAATYAFLRFSAKRRIKASAVTP